MKYKILLLIFLVNFILSLALFFNSSSGICQSGNGCDIVNNSAYSTFLGMKVSFWGIFIFGMLGLIALLQIYFPTFFKKFLIRSSITVGSLIAVYLVYLQFFVIKARCNFCLIIDFLMLATFAILIFWKE